MKLPELKKLVRVAKRAGVKRLVMPGVHLEFYEPARVYPEPKISSSVSPLTEVIKANMPRFDLKTGNLPVPVATDLPELGEEMPSDEEMVLYSTPFFGLEREQEESEETEVTQESEAS